ncbi:MAG TPA: putative porin [Candidatus Baltobacteraceae bacterium]|nr:putative porin [Candidatus Baltobacteraceae bacterium]
MFQRTVVHLNNKLAAILAGAAACLSLAATARAQVSADAILDKLVAKGILKPDEAQELKAEASTNTAKGVNFKLSNAIKSVEIYGDVRMRYEYRSAQLGPEAGQYAGQYDTANRWRYAVRLGVRGDLADDFYYGLRFETSPNERSPWNTFGNASGGQSPYYGPFSKANNYSLYIGQAYLGWRPTSWLDVSVGRVAQPLYTTSMVWDSDYCPEGAVEKMKLSYGPVDYFATFAQYVYQDTTPANAYAVEGGNSAATYLGDFSDQNAYLLAWQAGGTYHITTNISFKFAPIVYNYIGHGNQSSGFYGPFVGQGINGFTYNTNSTTSSSTLPGGTGATSGPTVTTSSYNQTGINNLSIIEFPAELNFKISSLNAKVFGDYSINLEGDARARAAYNAGEAIWATDEVVGNPNPFPGGVQLKQNHAMQIGMAVGNNLGLVYGTTSKKGTWEARVYWQRVEQYALDPNLLDSDFFEGRGNMQGLYSAFAYSFSDAIIGTLRYGWAERIDNQLGTGGFNADLPLPNPINKYQLVQVDLTWRY